MVWIKVLILSLDDEPIYNTNIPLSVDVWGQTYSEVWIDGDVDGFKLKLAFVDTFNTYISCLKLQTGNIPTEGFEATLEDVQEAKEKADNAGKDATEAKKRLDNWASDSVISPTEKQGIKDEIMFKATF